MPYDSSMHGSTDGDSHNPKEDVVPEGNSAFVGCVARVADTELFLMASRMAWWPQKRILLLADSHFGKAATFRKAGIPVPVGTTQRMLDVLSAAVNALQPTRVVILGDFIHSVISSQRDFERDLFAWRREHASLCITLVLGNHDRRRQTLFHALHLDLCHEEACDPFHFCHDPFAQEVRTSAGFRLGGHIHPGIRLGKQSRYMPCFWQGKDFLVFPAFGEFTGLAKIAPGHQDVVYPIASGQIAKISVADPHSASVSKPTGFNTQHG